MTPEQVIQIALKTLDADESYGITSMETSLVRAGYLAALAEVEAHVLEGVGLFSLERTHTEQVATCILLDFRDWLDQQIAEVKG